MAQKTVKNNPLTGKQIKQRRNDLGLTIEEAASKAGVGIKTWCRYEAGEAIRQDKLKGVFKVLNWKGFPQEDEEERVQIDLSEYKDSPVWPKDIARKFGDAAAASFVIGSDILLDKLNDDIGELESLPKGSHIGELSVSWIKDMLPEQFLMRYDYDFMYLLRSVIKRFRSYAKAGTEIIAHSVLEEITLYLIAEESEFLMEEEGLWESDEEQIYSSATEWVFDLFEDEDIITFLYDDFYLEKDNMFHFDHWKDRVFWVER